MVVAASVLTDSVVTAMDAEGGYGRSWHMRDSGVSLAHSPS